MSSAHPVPSSPDPLISIITPTFGRPWYLQQAARWVAAQTYARYEWLILDDSPEPCPALARTADPRIRYLHVRGRASIGAKRNELVSQARGQLIAHFDDDDYYAPDYLRTMLELMRTQQADFVKLSAWYLYDMRHDLLGYWALKLTTGLHFGCYSNVMRVHVVREEDARSLADNHLGYGFSYFYRRELWEHAPFGDANLREETAFIDGIRDRFRLLCVDDDTGIVLHLLHPQSSSPCHPQFRLPGFLLLRLFPAAAEFVQQARALGRPSAPAATGP